MTQSSYDGVHKFFHWTMAVLILVIMAAGFWAGNLPQGTPARRFLLGMHEPLALTAVALLVFRVGYRMLRRTPPHEESLSPLNRRVAHAAHLLLYALLIYMPITGLTYSQGGNHNVEWFGLPVPVLIPAAPWIEAMGKFLHDKGALVLYAVLGGHIWAALWHHFKVGDNVLRRMWPLAGIVDSERSSGDDRSEPL